MQEHEVADVEHCYAFALRVGLHSWDEHSTESIRDSGAGYSCCIFPSPAGGWWNASPKAATPAYGTVGLQSAAGQ